MNKTTLLLSSSVPQHITQAADIIKQGGLVALPTETVYGLAADGLSSMAIKSIYEAKNRPQNNPLILHVSSIEQALTLIELPTDITKKRFAKLASLWPCALTIIAKKSCIVPKEVSYGLDTVAIRMPDHKICLKVIELLNRPVAMPSANISTRPSPTCAQHVISTLNNRIDAVLDGGECSLGLESSVVDITQKNPTIARLGSFLKDDIETCLSERVELNLSSKNNPISPGQAFLHYSPKVKKISYVFEDDLEKYWFSDCSLLITKLQFEKMSLLGNRPNLSFCICLPDNDILYANKLYDSLYQFERYPNKDLVIVEPAYEHGIWPAIKEKLFKAAMKL